MYIILQNIIGVESLSFFSSGIFNKPLLLAPWSPSTEELFNSAGLISNIFEDLPQFVVGFCFLINFSSSVTATSILSVASSVITLSAGVIKRCLLRSLVNNQNSSKKVPYLNNSKESINKDEMKVNPLVTVIELGN